MDLPAIRIPQRPAVALWSGQPPSETLVNVIYPDVISYISDMRDDSLAVRGQIDRAVHTRWRAVDDFDRAVPIDPRQLAGRPIPARHVHQTPIGYRRVNLAEQRFHADTRGDSNWLSADFQTVEIKRDR